MNSVCLMGRLVRDPELRFTASQKAVASFTIAVDRGGDKTDFIDCVGWEKTGEFISTYFHKGDMIGITGRIQSRNYEDKNGNKRTAVEVVADRAFFTGSKKESEPHAESKPRELPQAEFTELEDEGEGQLPF